MDLLFRAGTGAIVLKKGAFMCHYKSPVGIDAQCIGLLGELIQRYPDTMIIITKGEDTVKASRPIQLIGIERSA